MYLRDLAVYADEVLVDRFPGGFVQRFHRETCCVVELYLSHLLRKAQTGNVAKVMLTFTDSLSGPPDRASIQELINVLVLPWPFDFEGYNRGNRQWKKRSVANELHAALVWLCDVRNWEKGPFKAAFAASIEQDLIFEGLSKASWKSPSGRFRARIFFHYDIDEVELYAVLYRDRTKKEIARRRLGTGVPEMGCLDQFLRNARWTSGTEFTVQATDFRQKTWQADFSEIT